MTQDISRHLLALLAAGNHVQAAAIAGELRTSIPDSPAAAWAGGMVALAQGDYDTACADLARASRAKPDDAVLACNHGLALLRSGQAAAARTQFERALARDPDYDLARWNLACACLALDDGTAALRLLRVLVRHAPDNMDWLCALGDARRTRGDWRRATATYRKVLARDENQCRAHHNLAILLNLRMRHEDAETHARRAMALGDRDTSIFLQLGNALAGQERYEEAMDAYADGHDQDPHFVSLLVAIGQCWLGQGEYREAGNWFGKAREQDPDSLDAVAGLASVALEQSDTERAHTLLEPLRDAGWNNPRFLDVLADACWDDGDADNALLALEQLLKVQPQRAATHARVGQIHSSSGDTDKARECFRRALALNPRCIPAINGLASADRGKLDPALAETAGQLLAKPGNRDGTNASLNFSLAYYHDGRKEHEAASRHLREANRLQWASRQRHGWEYDPGEHKAYIDEIIETFTADFFAAHRDVGSPDPTPVFVVGMPRSGTTLTEQILARHPAILGIGERNFAGRSLARFRAQRGNISLHDAMAFANARRLAPVAADYLATLQELVTKAGKSGVTRVVDKMPENFNSLGWIALLFPNARIIHCRRDVRDVAMSCFQTQFGAIRWACHPEHIVERIRQYQRVMAHWHQVLPLPILESDYETLTADQETQSRRLVEWTGLTWDPRCLSFYESDRLVRTASITQVRQPIYRSSVQKWKAYEPHLPDLLLPLAALNHTPLPEA